jgi:hypothetical protein
MTKLNELTDKQFQVVMSRISSLQSFMYLVNNLMIVDCDVSFTMIADNFLFKKDISSDVDSFFYED